MVGTGSSGAISRARLGLVLALAAAGVVAVLLAGSRGASSPTLGAAPGFREPSTTLDTRPFELAGPRVGGPSTIPDALLVQPEITEAPTTEPPTTAPTTTIQPPLYLPASVDSFCGISLSLRSLFANDPQRSPSAAEIDDALTGISRNLGAYRERAPELSKADIDIVSTAVRDLSAAFRAGGERLDFPPLQQVVQALANAQPPYQDVQPAIERIRIVEVQQCGSA